MAFIAQQARILSQLERIREQVKLPPTRLEDIVEEYVTGNDPNLSYQGTIGGGAFGQVHAILSLDSKAVFARKIIQISHHITREDIMSEVKAVNQLGLGADASRPPHRNLVWIFRHGWLKSYSREHTPSLPFYHFDMELGLQNFKDFICECHSASPPNLPSSLEIWDIVSQIALGLAFIHERALIHRDLKPENIIQSASHPRLWKIADFGISSPGTSKHLIVTNLGRGTESYCAPEILDAEQNIPSYTNKVDIWALGLLLYELFAGNCGFRNGFQILQYYHSTNLNGQPPQLAINSDERDLVVRISKFASMVSDHKTLLSEGLYTNLRTLSNVDPKTGPIITGPVEWEAYTTAQFRLQEVNALIRVMLHRDPKTRPGVQSLISDFIAMRNRYWLESLENHDELLFKEAESSEPLTLRKMQWDLIVSLQRAGTSDVDTLIKDLSQLLKEYSDCDIQHQKLDSDNHDRLLKLSLDSVRVSDFEIAFILKDPDYIQKLIEKNIRSSFRLVDS